ncbi:MAG: DNA polymerase/3'-5' exonuclease PolX [Candidatus Micrarchaeia archaeon]
MYNSKISELFNEIADMLDLEGDARSFEARAYRKAALVIGSLQEDVGDILKNKGIDGLTALPGVGKTLAERIKEYVETGKIKKYEDLKKQYPIDFDSLTKIQGLGAKRVFKLYKALGVKNVDDLRKALDNHRIRDIEGFGEKSEEEIKKGLDFFFSTGGRMLIGTALPEAESIVRKIEASGLAQKVTIAGSTRRMRETVGDLDILIVSSKSDKMMDFVAGLDEVENIVVKGPTKTTVMLKIGLTCDFRVVEKESFGSALQYFTGNKEHNVQLRQIAIKQGYKLNEYGIFDKSDKRVAGSDEKEVYAKLGMDYIEPEMREARGEIELAQQHRLPKLVTINDIRGDLHVHTTHTDGLNTLDEMVQKAVSLGYDYVGISDHTKSEYVAGGMNDKQFVSYFKEIDELQKRVGDSIKVLKSGEIDILKDGSLDLSNKTLEMMDYRLCAVHTNINMSKEQMTNRIIKAFESGYVDILAHPTDRLINERAGIQLDFDRLFQSAADNGVVLEINASPGRLDLNDELILKASQYKVKFIIGTDSHKVEHMDFMRYGIGMARRGWLEKKDIINTGDIKSLLKALNR